MEVLCLTFSGSSQRDKELFDLNAIGNAATALHVAVRIREPMQNEFCFWASDPSQVLLCSAGLAVENTRIFDRRAERFAAARRFRCERDFAERVIDSTQNALGSLTRFEQFVEALQGLAKLSIASSVQHDPRRFRLPTADKRSDIFRCDAFAIADIVGKLFDFLTKQPKTGSGQLNHCCGGIFREFLFELRFSKVD